MRRKDREVTDSASIESFIASQQIIRVGFFDKGEIYIVPVNYGYSVENGEYTFYFHGAGAGRKYELAEAEPEVGFEIDGKYELVPSEKACGYSANYKSVIGTGKLSLAKTAEEKIEGLNFLMKQVSGKKDFEYSEAMLRNVAVFRLKVKTMSCKEKI